MEVTCLVEFSDQKYRYSQMLNRPKESLMRTCRMVGRFSLLLPSALLDIRIELGFVNFEHVEDVMLSLGQPFCVERWWY
jgi:hypothetical protein